MKKSYYLIAIAIAWTAFYVHANPTLKAPNFKWGFLSHDFGKIKKGQPVSTIFRFTNDGGASLIISESKVACGCTASSYSKESIAPGKSGFVTVTFNAANTGIFKKSVTIYSNASDTPVDLVINGEVIE